MTQEKIFKIQVKYFLNIEGLSYFPTWYQEVLQEVRQQDGFREITYDSSKSNPIITLSFSREEKLELWASSKRHDELFEKIEAYFIQPVEVEIIEN